MVDNYYLNGIDFHKNTRYSHNFKANFDKILTLADQLDLKENLQFYPRRPTIAGAHIISFSLLQEVLGIDSERWLWSKLQTDYGADFLDLPHLTNYNRCYKRLAYHWGQYICPAEDTYMVNSMPAPVAYIVREHSTRVCREPFHPALDKGYSTITGQYYIGYKLYLVVSLHGVYQNMDLTKVSIHDVHYLKDIKNSGLNNYLLLTDKGCLSREQKIDLFYSTGIELQTPMQCNQQGYQSWPTIFKMARQRIEMVCSQLCDQMMIKRNYIKAFVDPRARVISKVASITLLQFINWLNDKPMNQIKYALAA